MKKPYTVQCGYTAHFANTVTVEAETLEEALEKAIETANADDAWRSTGRLSRTFVDAVCEGAGADPRDTDAAWPVPERFTERGEPPVVTLTDPGRAGGGAIEVSGAGSCSASRPLTPRSRARFPIRPIPRPTTPSSSSVAAPTARPTSP